MILLLHDLQVLFLEKCDSPDGYPFMGEDFVTQMKGSKNALIVLKTLLRQKYITRANYFPDGNKVGGYHFGVFGTKITPDGKRWLQKQRKY